MPQGARRLFAILAALVLAFSSKPNRAADAKVYESEGQKFKYEQLLKRDDVIWGFDFLSDGRMIFTERSGKLFTFDLKTGAAKQIKNVPKVRAEGQGGLLDVRVHPSQASRIYLAYSEPVGADKATTALATAELSGDELKNVKKLFSAHEPNSKGIHFGSRIEFDGKGHIYLSVGDRDKRAHAQDLRYHQGKVVRLKEDGTAANDNPFIGKENAKPEIWSYGHRSPQGLDQHPQTGELWIAEMGPRGGDELNVVKKGANYGWPMVTYGREYYGPSIGVKEKPGVEQPVVYWVPSISPSAFHFYTGDKFPKWKHNAFLACLSGLQLRRVVLDGQKVVKQEELLQDLSARFRNVRTGPDGFLYLSTDDGQIARLVPAK